MKKYSSYKPSGIEWIGKIPEHWNMISLKNLVSTKITDGPHETPTFLDDGIPFLSVESVQDNKLDFDKKRGFISKEVHDLYSKKCKPHKDDVLIVKSGSTTGKSTIVETDLEFNIWSPLCIVRSDKNKVLPRFTFSSIQSDYFRRSIELGWSFGTQPNIGMGVIENIKLVVPPLTEQQQIVQFLDEKTEIIDKLISIKERKIDLLKEQRISLINQGITKGLYPDVKMRNSRVDWIGEIPEHWKLVYLRHYTKKVGSGVTPKGGSETYVDDGVTFVRSQNVHFDGLTLDDVVKISTEVHEIMSSSKVINEDVLLNITGGSIGRCCVVITDEEMNVNQHVCIIRPKNKLSSFFLNFYLQSSIGQSFVKYFISGGNREGLTFESIKCFQIPLPTMNEQIEIVKYLKTQTIEIYDLISLEQKKIDLLKEYRQSLISEVITGKIDVRNNLN